MLSSVGCCLDEKVGSRDSLFQVRSYQRFYVWSEEKVKTYLDDIQTTITRYVRDNSIVHFFGQMIFLEISRDGRGRKTYEVIDGQQRLTTFLITVAAVVGKTRQLYREYPDIKDTAEVFENDCKLYLKSVKEGAEPIDKLVLPPQDNDYFQGILRSLANCSPVTIQSTPISHKHLFLAQQVIANRIDSIIRDFGTPEEKLHILQQFFKVATERFQIVVIEPNSEIYTYQLYQVVNDRGEPLKDSELLKAKSLEVLSSNAIRIEEAKNIWNDILADPGNETENYLKWCYLSSVGADKDDARYYHAYLRNYFQIQDNMILTEDEQIAFLSKLSGLHEDIKLCRKLANGIWPFEQGTCQQWQKNVLSGLILGMKHTLCIPVLISAYHQPTHHGVSKEDNFYSCLELCETFFIILKGICGWREDKFKSKYLQASLSMRNNPTTYRARQFKEALIAIDPQEVQRNFQSNINGITYKSKGSNSLLKYLLFMLETYYPSYDANNVPSKNRIPDGTNVVYSELSIEHIYPKVAQAGDEDEQLERCKNSIGNLLPYGKNANSRLKSKPYPEKRPFYLTARLATVTTLAGEHTTWTYEDYQSRSIDVCEKLKKLLLRFYPA